MKINLNSFLLILLLCPIFIFGQTSINGIVTDEISSSPIAGVNVLVKDSNTVGINFISLGYIEAFIKRLEECDDNDYFERALEIAIEKDGFKIKAIDISEFNCIEIDFEEDLKNANNLI